MLVDFTLAEEIYYPESNKRQLGSAIFYKNW